MDFSVFKDSERALMLDFLNEHSDTAVMKKAVLAIPAQTLIAKENGKIIAAIVFWNEGDKYTVYFRLLVDKRFRKRGIGSYLLTMLYSVPAATKATYIQTCFIENVESEKFLNSKGFKPHIDMLKQTCKKISGCYELPFGCTIEKLGEKETDSAIKLESDCFYSLRRKHDIRPYACYGDTDTIAYFNENIDSIYVLKRDSEIIGKIEVLSDMNLLENLCVKKEYTGKGYGKTLMLFGMTEIYCKKKSIPDLYVASDNPASFLYYGLGYRTEQTVRYMRKSI